MTAGYRVKRIGNDGGESTPGKRNPPPLKSMTTTRRARMDNKELVDRLREALKYDGYNRMVADIIEELENGMKNKEKAGAYRGAAEFLDREGYRVSDVLREKADELDPPRPEPGPIVFEDGTHGLILRDRLSLDDEYDIVTEYGELLMLEDAAPYKPALQEVGDD
jgi:hypothetical protein